MRTQIRCIIRLVIILACAAVTAVRSEGEGWTLKAACGANLVRGNSDTTSANLELSADRKDAANECHLGALYAYGETDDEVSEENSKAEGQYNRLLSERVYLYLNGKAERDDIAMLDYRVLAGPGAGCYLVKEDDHSLKIEAGVSYLGEKLTYTDTADDAATETVEREETTALRVMERYEGKLGQAKVWQSIEYLPETDDPEVYLLAAEAGIETLVTDLLSLRVAVTDKYDSDPAPDTKENDVTIRASLVLSLGP